MAFYSLGSSVQPYNILDRYIAPWQNYQATDVQRLAYINDPEMAATAYTNMIPTSGQGAVSPNFYNWIRSQMGNYFNQFKGWQAQLPQEEVAARGGWDDYIKAQDPFQDYMNTNPYSNVSNLARPTRFILRR